MSVRIGDIAPDFIVDTTTGPIKFHDTQVTFPIVADSDLAIAKLYEMIHPSESEIDALQLGDAKRVALPADWRAGRVYGAEQATSSNR